MDSNLHQITKESEKFNARNSTDAKKPTRDSNSPSRQHTSKTETCQNQI
jgi:hypothetical protein